MASYDYEKALLRCHYDLKQFSCMGSCLKNAATTICDVTHIMLSSVKRKLASINFDDRVVFSCTPRYNIDRIRIYLRLLKKSVCQYAKNVGLPAKRSTISVNRSEELEVTIPVVNAI